MTKLNSKSYYNKLNNSTKQPSPSGACPWPYSRLNDSQTENSNEHDTAERYTIKQALDGGGWETK